LFDLRSRTRSRAIGPSPAAVPAFHDKAPAKGEMLPAVMTEKQLADGGFTAPVQQESYKAAAKVRASCTNSPATVSATVLTDTPACIPASKSPTERIAASACGSALRLQDVQERLERQNDPRRHHPRDYKQMDLQHPEQVN